MSKFLSFLSLVLVGSTFAAEPIVTAPELVISGKRLRGDHRSARVFTESDLARESGRTLGVVLREAGGIDFTAGTGGNSNVLIRGSSGSQTLVIIDGVKANDPSATNRYFDWSRIDVSQIERVEILKGPQAVSYGSDAIGGVILITTKRDTMTTATVEAGSEAFVRARGNVGSDLGSALGGEHALSFQALGKGVFSGGSSALSPTGSKTEGDNSKEASVGLALKSRWGRDTRSTVTADLRAADEDIDNGAFTDAPNVYARNREIRGSGTLDGKFGNGMEWGGLASHLDFRRAYGDTVYLGKNTRAELHLRSDESSVLEWTAGMEGTHETLKINSLLFPVVLNRDHDQTYAFFAESAAPLVSSKALALDFGSRFSHFESYGNQWSGKAGVSAKPMAALDLDAGISTGFKAPSLYSLYDPTYGNTALKPEESVQIEAGFEARPIEGTSVSLRGFQSRITNRFGYDPSTFKSMNVARAEISGIELEGENRFTQSLRVLPSLTYLSTKDLKTGTELSDVSKWKGTLKLAYDLSAAHSATLSIVAKSSRGTSVANTKVAGFYRVDFTTRHRLAKTLSLTTRFENLFNRDYQEVRGYRTPGISGYLGLEFASL